MARPGWVSDTQSQPVSTFFVVLGVCLVFAVAAAVIVVFTPWPVGLLAVPVGVWGAVSVLDRHFGPFARSRIRTASLEDLEALQLELRRHGRVAGRPAGEVALEAGAAVTFLVLVCWSRADISPCVFLYQGRDGDDHHFGLRLEQQEWKRLRKLHGLDRARRIAWIHQRGWAGFQPDTDPGPNLRLSGTASSQQEPEGPDPAEARPSPELIAARYVVGDLDETLVPTWAAWWIVDGHDGPAVVALAGLDGFDALEVREALPLAFSELGVTVPPFARAWRSVATDRAAACLAGRLDEFELAAWVEHIYIASDYDGCVLEEPVGSIYGVEDERIGGWGRTNDELRAAVRSACTEQVQHRSE